MQYPPLFKLKNNNNGSNTINISEACKHLKSNSFFGLSTGKNTTIYWNGHKYDVDYGGEEIQISESEFKRRFASCDFREMSVEEYAR